jgi:hypothetical protein
MDKFVRNELIWALLELSLEKVVIFRSPVICYLLCWRSGLSGFIFVYLNLVATLCFTNEAGGEPSFIKIK